MSPLAPPVVCPHITDMSDGQTVLRNVLDANPASTRTLAQEAGVSEKLLRLVRDGERRLTPQVRAALVDVLRRWERELRQAADGLEAADLEAGGDDG